MYHMLLSHAGGLTGVDNFVNDVPGGDAVAVVPDDIADVGFSRDSSSVLLASVAVMVLPSASRKTQEGVWLCQTRVWPRHLMPLAWAKVTACRRRCK